ncbi:TetR/AcrR family transcriptional regulator C-terminal domain-containing protein [Microtetraspora malaysiensis]|uniref:TetR/AcrR family transcriptional regulator C-terminal domain-containing protein n=1 Tax=Microtetraspora malaysiensis TaxID=161358 RepID=UPI000832908E|nr:TetR/AcrR family transcriptional regulator C-terminal domain-containing protein [Microtetraspora malaysiensis]
MDEDPPPYLRIVTELRRRITAGRLRPGDRVPSTRQITREWGVAMATATKALATLQQEGLVRPVPGVGTVVADAGTGAVPSRRSAPELSEERIVRAAIAIADAEGLATLTMRRIATSLGTSVMALYRYVSGRDELVTLMADRVLADGWLPEPQPPGWRACLEWSARRQWALYRRHPWLAQAVSFTRPMATPHAMAQGEWGMRVVDGLGLDPVTMVHIYVTVANYVHGTAAHLEAEAEAVQQSGTTDDEWLESAVLPQMREFPLLSRIPPDSLDLNTLFEFGLRRLLDGVATLIASVRAGSDADVDRPH